MRILVLGDDVQRVDAILAGLKGERMSETGKRPTNTFPLKFAVVHLCRLFRTTENLRYLFWTSTNRRRRIVDVSGETHRKRFVF